MLVTQPFRVGDQIVAKGHKGTVEEIQTRATLIRTYDGRRVVIPNADLFTDTVVVNTAFAHRRLEYDVGIGCGDDVERARSLILETVRTIDGVLDDPAPDVLPIDLASSSVNLRVRWWISPPQRSDALDSRDRVLTAVKATLTAEDIDLPFPTSRFSCTTRPKPPTAIRRGNAKGGRPDTARCQALVDGAPPDRPETDDSKATHP